MLVAVVIIEIVYKRNKKKSSIKEIDAVTLPDV